MIAIDIETTGLDPKKDGITEIAAVKFNGNRIEDTFQTLINPNRPIPQNIIQLTHITNEMVRNAPQAIDVMEPFAKFIGQDMIVGHNIAFDLSFLQRGGILRRNPFCDTYDLASILLPSAPRYNLGALGQQMGILVKDQHRALSDCMTTMQVYLRLMEEMNQLPIDLVLVISSLINSGAWSSGALFRENLEARVRAGEKRNAGFRVPSPLIQTKWNSPEDEMNPVENPSPLDEDEIAAILEHGGMFSKTFPSFQQRPQQIEMLRSVCGAFSHGQHMLIEAGTGTGKSFAYLVPAFFWAIKNGERVVISTNTINLQDQLIRKDIPDLEKALSMELRATIQKGRGNYLCPRILDLARSRGAESPEEARVIGKILVWLFNGGSGDRGEINLNGPIERDIWTRLSAETESCRPNQCAYRRKNACPFYAIRDQAQRSHVVIVNHALLLADVAMGNTVLPEYRYLIIDEGHHLESAATTALGFRITPYEIFHALREMGNSSSGLLGRTITLLQTQISEDNYQIAKMAAEEVDPIMEKMEPTINALFREIQNYMAGRREGAPLSVYGQQLRITGSSRAEPEWTDIEIAWDNSSLLLQKYLKQIKKIHKGISELEELGEETTEQIDILGGACATFLESVKNMENLFMTPSANSIYWVDISAVNNNLSLNAAPLQIGPLIEKHLWHEKESIILTSATLTTDQSFDYMRERLSADEANELCVGSPFDYENSVMLFLPTDIPDPNQNASQYMVENALTRLCKATGGRALALFTSYAQLKKTSTAISRELNEAGISVFEQGEGVSATALLDTFRKTDQAVLLGTRSFWEGVDIQGEKLSVVVIVKLPFDVPSDPIVAARSEIFENPFAQYSLPEAILKFRQGFGRLIRSESDRGIVVVLDNRLTKKSYGAEFINSIPKCTQRFTSIRDLPREAARWLNL